MVWSVASTSSWNGDEVQLEVFRASVKNPTRCDWANCFVRRGTKD
jgi:hypothetical protein